VDIDKRYDWRVAASNPVRDGPSRNVVGMTPEEIADLAHLRRARDLMDRDYAQPLDVPAMARALLRQGMSVTDTCVSVGCTSLGSFSSRFTEIVGETPSRYRARDHRDREVVPSCVSKVATRPRRSRVAV
jgi:methylphosphotriester-DNA--protein-cysteine methyltransferase